MTDVFATTVTGPEMMVGACAAKDGEAVLAVFVTGPTVIAAGCAATTGVESVVAVTVCPVVTSLARSRYETPYKFAPPDSVLAYVAAADAGPADG
jgi:hypothetical protein